MVSIWIHLGRLQNYRLEKKDLLLSWHGYFRYAESKRILFAHPKIIKIMKLTRALLLAGAGAAVGLWLARTESGKNFRKDVARKSDQWGKKIGKVSASMKDGVNHLAEEATNAAKNTRKKIQES